MKNVKRVMSLILAVCMCFLSPVVSNSASLDEITNAALEFVYVKEGTYDTVLANDYGAISIGRLGWHATRALTLLKSIVDADKTTANTLLGSTLYNEILTATNWETRTFSAAEKSAVQKLLTSDAGKKAQDSLAYSDVCDYIKHGQTLGLTDGKVLVYFADLQNQGGSGMSDRVAATAKSVAGSYSAVTLSIIHSVALEDRVAGNQPSRRKDAYDYCIKLTFDSVDSYSTGTYKISSGTGYVNFRTGAGTSYDKTSVGQIPNNTQVSVTEISNGWGKVTYNDVTGWISMEYTLLVSSDEVYSVGTYTVNSEIGYVNFRSGPAVTYEMLSNSPVPNGTKVTVTEVKYDWGKITYGGNTGWINLEYTKYVTETETTTAEEKTTSEFNLIPGIYTFSSGLGYVNFREGPGLSYSTLKVSPVPNGTKLTITEVQDGWGKTTYNGASGWILMEYGKYTPATETTTDNGTTALSETTTAAETTTLAETTTVAETTTLAETTTAAETTKAAETTTLAETTTSGSDFVGIYTFSSGLGYVNFREGPGVTYNMLKESPVPNGTKLTVTETKSGWGKVTYNGVSGWISMEYGTLVSSAETTTEKPMATTIPTSETKPSSTETSPDTSAIKGDLNSDGRITAADARMLLQYSAGLVSLTDTQKILSDVNGDGKINSSDARFLLRVAADLDTL